MAACTFEHRDGKGRMCSAGWALDIRYIFRTVRKNGTFLERLLRPVSRDLRYLCLPETPTVISRIRMKKFCAVVFLAFCIAGIAFLVFLQRVEKPLPPVLLRADSLCNACPELAIRLLYSIAPSMEQADRRVRSRYALLTIKARDKAFIPPHLRHPHPANRRLLQRAWRHTGTGGGILLPWKRLSRPPQLTAGGGQLLESTEDSAGCP